VSRLAAASVAALALAGAAAAQPATAPFGLICHLTQRYHSTCHGDRACSISNEQPFDQTRRYVVDPARQVIDEYGRDGAVVGQPFDKPITFKDGKLTAAGHELGMGQAELASLTVDLAARTGRLDILFQPGGEAGHGATDYHADGVCTVAPVDSIRG
jgi:hypothetical protein